MVKPDAIVAGYTGRMHMPIDRRTRKELLADLEELRLQLEATRRQRKKTLESGVSERNTQLSEKDPLLLHQSQLAAMGELIGCIAHQWRQPLNNLGLLIQQTALRHELGELNGEFLEENVRKSMELIQMMSRTIDDFRNLFRPDKEKISFAVHDQVVRALSLMEGSFRGRNIDVRIDLQGNPVIVGYPNEFSQVLLAILIIARDTLIERKTPGPKVLITVAADRDRAIVTIADNAGSIPSPSFTTKGPRAGTGTGLYMAKTIVEKKMNGLLSMRNFPGGAEFRIEI